MNKINFESKNYGFLFVINSQYKGIQFDGVSFSLLVDNSTFKYNVNYLSIFIPKRTQKDFSEGTLILI